MMRRWIVLAMVMTLAAGCATGGGDAAPQAAASERAVGRFVSSPWTFSTAAYWVEGPEGVVVFDTLFTRDDAQALLAAAQEATGKPVVAAVVLHANPDKFNGTAAFQAAGVRVITSEQVLALIPSVHAKRVDAFYERYKAAGYPLEEPRPESFGPASTEVVLAGVPVKLHVLGAGCSEAHVAAQVGGDLFVGDLVAHQTHSWLEIGRTDAWLDRIDELEALGATTIHPGRGPSGGPELLAAQRRYLQDVIQAVAAERPQGEPDVEALKRVRAAVEAKYPRYAFPVFLKIGLPAEWRRQAPPGA